MKKFTALFALICLCLLMLFQAPALADRTIYKNGVDVGYVGSTLPESRSMLDYKVTPGVIYGKGKITPDDESDDESVSRKLWMDVYEPLEDTEEKTEEKPRPAVIFTHGGAFHRGSPRYTYDEDGAQDTSPGDYCRKFATRGYVCFAINVEIGRPPPLINAGGFPPRSTGRATHHCIRLLVYHLITGAFTPHYLCQFSGLIQIGL